MSTLLNSVPLPVQDPIAQPRRRGQYKESQKDPHEGMLTAPWVEFFTQQSLALEQAPARIQTIALTAQGASIAPTDMSDGALSGGLYRITYYARITQAATTSSSLTVSFDWTDGGASPVFTGAAMTGNTVTTVQSGSFLIRIDANSPVRYSTTYASVGGTPMLYSLTVVLEQVAA